jgi:hypothetical protein
VNESGVLALIEQRHKEDVFVPHCKNGPTNAIGAKVLILDAWVLLSTWSPLTCVGYEVKVSRSDWLRDGKFEAYLPLCNLFYVVAPKGVVQLAELPESVGLLEPIGSGDGTRLVTRRKAARREIEWPRHVMAYALMWRAGKTPDKAARAEQWAGWAERREQYERVGLSVAKRIRDEHEKLQRENDHLKRKHETYDGIRDALVRLGFDLNHISSWGVEREIERRQIAPTVQPIAQQLRMLAQQLDRIVADKETAVPA